ncbi:hypothetical protein BH20VER1_BH20VER1_19830 [soil metagenome]
MKQDHSTAIVVLGVHRSGTSAFAGALHAAGVPFGSRLMEGNDWNRKGYWEHTDIVQLHNELFALLGSSWKDLKPLPPDWFERPAARAAETRLLEVVQRDFGDKAMWGIKDPRLCRLLPLWDRIFEEAAVTPRYVLIARHPVEVAKSLARRDHLPLWHGERLWLDHLLAAEAHTRESARACVTYEELLQDAAATIGRIAGELQISWPRPLEEAREEIGAFVTPALRHQRAGGRKTRRAPELMERVYRALEGLSRGEGEERIAELDEIRGATRAAAELYLPEIEEVRATIAHVDQLVATAEKDEELQSLVALLQVFFPTPEGSYSEAVSVQRFLQVGRWERVSIAVPVDFDPARARVRFDPGNAPGAITLGGAVLRDSVSGAIRWKTEPETIELIEVGGTACRVPSETNLMLLSYGADPQVILPPITEQKLTGPLDLELFLKIDASDEAVVGALQQATTLLNERTATARKQAEKSEVALTTARQQAEESEVALTAARERAAAAERHLQEVQVQLSQSTDALEAETHELVAVQQQLAQAEQQLADVRETAMAQAEAHRLASVRLQEQLHTAVEQGEVLRRDLATARERLSQTETELHQLETRTRRSESELRRTGQLANEWAVAARAAEASAHSLSEELHLLGCRLEKAEEELSAQRVRRADLTAKLRGRDSFIQELQQSLIWKMVKPVWRLAHRGDRSGHGKRTAQRGDRLAAAVDEPQVWEFENETVQIRGWCFARTGDAVVGVRAKVGKKTFYARYGLSRFDVSESLQLDLGPEAACGFFIEILLPAGKTTVSLEAISDGGEWEPFLQTEAVRSS